MSEQNNPSSKCSVIKVALAEIERRLNDAPDVEEELELDQEKSRLQAKWRAARCSGQDIDWPGVAIDPPTDAQIQAVRQAMPGVAQATISAMTTSVFIGGINTILEQIG